MPHERKVITTLLFVLAGAAWGMLIWFSAASHGEAMGLTMGMSAPLFLAIWVVMMVAMMFPTAAPMILMFTRVHAERQSERSFVPTWVFVSAYLIVWALFGMLAYVLAIVIDALAGVYMWLADSASQIAGGVLVLAGLYQRSPLKHACLSKCRTPLDFILGSWREGYWGAFRMGSEHGFYCLGCCWLLFALLFVVGTMNLGAMGIVTLLVFAEKSLPAGQRIGRIASLAMVTYGLVAILMPAVFPVMW